MKKIIIAFCIVCIFLSFGFILKQHPIKESAKLEKISTDQKNGSGDEMSGIKKMNDDQW